MNDMSITDAIQTDPAAMYLDGFKDAVKGMSCPQALEGVLGVTKGTFDSPYGRGFRAGTSALAKATSQANDYAEQVATQ